MRIYHSFFKYLFITSSIAFSLAVVAADRGELISVELLSKSPSTLISDCEKLLQSAYDRQKVTEDYTDGGRYLFDLAVLQEKASNYEAAELNYRRVKSLFDRGKLSIENLSEHFSNPALIQAVMLNNLACLLYFGEQDDARLREAQENYQQAIKLISSDSNLGEDLCGAQLLRTLEHNLKIVNERKTFAHRLIMLGDPQLDSLSAISEPAKCLLMPDEYGGGAADFDCRSPMTPDCELFVCEVQLPEPAPQHSGSAGGSAAKEPQQCPTLTKAQLNSIKRAKWVTNSVSLTGNLLGGQGDDLKLSDIMTALRPLVKKATGVSDASQKKEKDKSPKQVKQKKRKGVERPQDESKKMRGGEVVPAAMSFLVNAAASMESALGGTPPPMMLMPSWAQAPQPTAKALEAAAPQHPEISIVSVECKDARGLDVDDADRNGNFVVVNMKVEAKNITVKLYRTRYFQLYGLRDIETASGTLTAQACAQAAISMLVDAMQPNHPTLSAPAEAEMVVNSISATHQGITCLAMAKAGKWEVNLDVLADKLKEISGVEVTRNSRNHAVVVSMVGRKGSWTFHRTGRVQVMGAKAEDLDDGINLMCEAIREQPAVLMITAPSSAKSSTSASGGSAGAGAAENPSSEEEMPLLPADFYDEDSEGMNFLSQQQRPRRNMGDLFTDDDDDFFNPKD